MGDIEVNRNDVSRRETDWKSNGLKDMRSGEAIKELNLNRRNRFGKKVVVLNVLGVNNDEPPGSVCSEFTDLSC